MKNIWLGLVLAFGFASGFSAKAQAAAASVAVQSPGHPLSAEASFFHDQLAPYGEWLWIDPHGWVWMPDRLDLGWRPYSDGRWAYSDCGWTWVSDQPWGWAAFHYGRWFYDSNYGWCWVPGSEWAPAWVTWHWGDDWCGWAPMPPAVDWKTAVDWDAIVPSFSWCFVAHKDFCNARLRDCIVLSARNVTLLRQTRNITHFELRDKAVVNLSLPAEQVEKAIGRAVPRFKIAEINSPGETQRALKGKTVINVYRPVVKETKVTTPVGNFANRTAVAEPSFKQIQDNEAAHRQLETQQAREHDSLEKLHQSQIRTPPPGVTPKQLMDQQEAEHRAFSENVARQNQLLQYRLHPQQSASPVKETNPSRH